MLAALIMIFFVVPNEKVQGVTQRIFYFHVHLAWMAFGGGASTIGPRPKSGPKSLARGEKGVDDRVENPTN